MDVSGEFWSRFDTWAGPTFGVILLCVGAFLMFRGATKIEDSIISDRLLAIGQLGTAFCWSDRLTHNIVEGEISVSSHCFMRSDNVHGCRA